MAADAALVAAHRDVTPGRRRAFEVVRDVRAGERADASFERRAEGLDRRERAFAMELAYGAIRWRVRLDHHLDQLLERGIGNLPDSVVAILELGAYQILFLDRVPAWAAIDQSVQLAREALAPREALWATGVVNGVLRNLVRRKDELGLPAADDRVTRLAVEHSHPRWLVRRWLARLGEEATVALLTRDNRPPDLHLAVDPRSTTPDALVEALRTAGFEAETHPANPDAVVIPGNVRPDELPGWREGRFWVQDAAAQWVASLADPLGDRLFLDACAAPGGKLAAVMGRNPEVQALAVDRDRDRVELLRANRERLRLCGAWIIAADTRALPTRERFPLVLVDAPCTGTGVLARRPDARWRREPADVGRFAAYQGELLDRLADHVEPGGVLLYATCSLEPEENAGVVESFVARRSDFGVDPVAGRVPANHRAGPYLSTRPWRSDLDGMFAARLARKRD